MSNPTIHFTLSFVEPQAHYVEVEMSLQGFDQDFIDLKMPVWTPGSYLVREYARHVERVSAYADEEHIPCTKVAKDTWRIQHQGKPVKVKYSVYGFEVSVRTNFIDSDHAFISPAGTFLYPDNYLHLPSTIAVLLPASWSKISTGLPTVENQAHTFYAADFDILFDAPLEIGNQDVWHFEAAGIPHEFAMVGTANYSQERLSKDITKIVEVETEIWGENPNKNYVFITHNYQSGFGGLEHLNSTVLAASRNSYAHPSAYKNFLSLVAHEYFHLWNVKRLRPTALGPFDYSAENYTTGLWIMEGFTAYYDNLIVRRCGFFSEEEYLNQLAIDFNTVYNRQGYKIQSAALASFDTWIKQYRPDENSVNTSISYYNKGAMLAAAIDLKIIGETKGAKRLDAVLKAAYQHFYVDKNRGFEEDEFQELAEQVSGVNLGEIFYAAHHDLELDYNDYFGRVGYQLIDQNAQHHELSFGIKTSTNDGRLLIKQIERNSAAWDAGLSVDDEIIALNGIRVDAAGKELEYIHETSQENDIIDLLIARDGLLKTIPTPLRRSSKKIFVIKENPAASAAERELGKLWLATQ